MHEKRSDERLFEVLKEKDPSLASQLEKIREKGLEDWIGLLREDKGSHAGYPHLQNVERIADKIVPDDLKHDLSAGELFLLLSAIFLHDIGKVIPVPPKTLCKKGPGGNCKAFINKLVNDPETEPYDRDVHPPCRKPQWDHYQESEKIIREQGVSLGLPDERMAQYCGLLAYCHGLKIPPDQDRFCFEDKKSGSQCVYAKNPKSSNFRDTSLAPYGKMRIPLLAAILRIADETDNLWTRTIREYWYRRLQSRSYKLGKAFRRHIEDIEFSHEGECLIVHVAGLDDANRNQRTTAKISRQQKQDIKSINKAREDMREVITGQWGKILEKHGIYFAEVFIEYEDRLYERINDKFTPQPLGEVIKREDLKLSLEELFDVIKQLFLGSYKYGVFTWHSLEAQVGRPLTDAEKWLVGKMGKVSNDFRISADPREENIRIEISKDADIEIIEKDILGK
jgi:hypothetical protein